MIILVQTVQLMDPSVFQLSLSSSFYHLTLLPLRTAAMNAVIYSAAIAGQSLFQARRLTSVLQGCFDWLLCVKECFIFRFNPCTTCDIKSAYICSSTQYSGCVIAEKKYTNNNININKKTVKLLLWERMKPHYFI